MTLSASTRSVIAPSCAPGVALTAGDSDASTGLDGRDARDGIPGRRVGRGGRVEIWAVGHGQDVTDLLVDGFERPVRRQASVDEVAGRTGDRRPIDRDLASATDWRGRRPEAAARPPAAGRSRSVSAPSVSNQAIRADRATAGSIPAVATGPVAGPVPRRRQD